MNPHIYEFTPFSVIGYPQRQRKSNVKRTADIPAYWDSLKMDSAALLTKLHDTFTASKHFEISMCYDIDTENGELHTCWEEVLIIPPIMKKWNRI